MVTMTVIAKVKPEKQRELLQVIRSLDDDSEKNEGLKNPALYRKIDDQTCICLMYQWETRQDWEQYLGAEKLKVLLGALKVLCERSDIRYSHICEMPLPLS
jgi:quinol monooxygenase YgiN